MTGGACIHGRSADTNLAEIHEEMSELLDKQVNVQNESLKITSGVHVYSRKPPKKVVSFSVYLFYIVRTLWVGNN